MSSDSSGIKAAKLLIASRRMDSWGLGMKLVEIETADCQVLRTSLGTSGFSVHFKEIYDLNIGCYVNDVVLSIGDWRELVMTAFATDPQGLTIRRKQLSMDEFEAFDLVQEILIAESGLTLNGFSKDSNDWLSYEFVNCSYAVDTVPR